MNKMAEYTRGRADGLDLAFRIVREDGIEALEKEIKFRGATGIHTSLAKKDVERSVELIKNKMVDMFSIIGIAALHDLYGFGETRCTRWMKKVEEAASYLSNDLATWDDYISEIKTQIGIDINIDWRD